MSEKLKTYLIPTSIFCCYLALYLALSFQYDNNYLFLPIWDIDHYLTISLTGYEVYPCTPGVNGPLSAICGNPGWFPAWPLLVKFVRPIMGGSSQLAFNILPATLMLLAFILLYRFMEKRFGVNAAVICLLAMAFNPSGFYWLTGFPYAFIAFLFTVYINLLYAKDNRYSQLGLFATALTLSATYPTGILFAIIPLVKYLSDCQWKLFDDTKKVARLILYLIPFALGPLILFTYFYFEFNDFWLQLHFQEKYDRNLAFPLWVMLKSFITQPLLSAENVTLLWYLLGMLLFIPFKIKKEFWILGLCIFLFSLTTGTTMSIFRHYLIIIPLYMMIGSSGRSAWLKYSFIAIGLALSLFILFPEYMSMNLM